MPSFDYLKAYRGMPWIKRGMPVDMNGKRGVVTRSAPGGGLRIRFDGEKRSKPCHPHWQMTYYNKDGSVRHDYKKKG